MKKLKKLVLLDGNEELSENEMKNLRGGSYNIHCARWQGNKAYCFSTTSADVSGTWCDVWLGFGWNCDCFLESDHSGPGYRYC